MEMAIVQCSGQESAELAALQTTKNVLFVNKKLFYYMFSVAEEMCTTLHLSFGFH